MERGERIGSMFILFYFYFISTFYCFLSICLGHNYFLITFFFCPFDQMENIASMICAPFEPELIKKQFHSLEK